MRPIVGITIGRRHEATGPGPGKSPVAGTQAAYTQAVIRAGGAPVLLPWSDEPEVIASVVERIDALLLSGGGDVHPEHYGAPPHRAESHQDAVRDRMEFRAIREALGRGLPMLGICRGIQTLNVAFGGTLVQDIPDQLPAAGRHHTIGEDHAPDHEIDVEPGSLLAEVLGATSAVVNSRHHQAVRDVGDGLRVNCRSRDGIIEGLESAEGLAVLAVQCHPEDHWERHPAFPRLFAWLIAAAGRKKVPGTFFTKDF
ncbi:MAG TPA: gamma-glutamyl-gamma-aminobutyrate hydrolase family protein [Phycisphaerae bacterium]|nr:gamma-glutamyl-gamma-aminobutyrate hydrolase family protein [Phycisphaerae bacterium]